MPVYYQILKEEITPTLAKLKDERSSYLEYQKIIRELEHLNKLYIAYQFVCAEVYIAFIFRHKMHNKIKFKLIYIQMYTVSHAVLRLWHHVFLSILLKNASNWLPAEVIP